MTDMMNFQSLPRDDRPAPAVQSTPTSASPLRPLPTRHEAIGSVFEVSGGGARIQISGPRLRELAADADPSVAMSGQVGSQVKLESGGRWLLANVQIGRAACRERVGQYVEISVVAEYFKKKNKKNT